MECYYLLAIVAPTETFEDYCNNPRVKKNKWNKWLQLLGDYAKMKILFCNLPK